MNGKAWPTQNSVGHVLSFTVIYDNFELDKLYWNVLPTSQRLLPVLRMSVLICLESIHKF